MPIAAVKREEQTVVRAHYLVEAECVRVILIGGRIRGDRQVWQSAPCDSVRRRVVRHELGGNRIDPCGRYLGALERGSLVATGGQLHSGQGSVNGDGFAVVAFLV